MNEYEVRSFEGIGTPTTTDESRTIEGYAVVFNERSLVMYDPREKKIFTEVIKPGAITEGLLQRSDVKALLEHNRERLLARSNKGQGTLTLILDERGLKYRFEAPNTPDGNFAREMIKRGDISGSSFAFRAYSKDATSWTKEPDGTWLRTVNVIDDLRDVTITSDPAFTGTQVSTRSIEDLEKGAEPKDEAYKVELLNLRTRI